MWIQTTLVRSFIIVAISLMDISNVVSVSCPQMPVECKCYTEEKTMTCTTEDRKIKYIPKLPPNVLSFTYKKKWIKNITSDTFRNLSVDSLERLGLDNNRITNISSDAFIHFKKLTYLSLGENPSLTVETVQRALLSFHGYPCTLNSLFLRRMGWTRLPHNFFDGLKGCNITRITLRSNRFSAFDFRVFHHFRQTLQYLDLSRNYIISVNLDFLPTLIKLDIGRNRLTTAPKFCANGSFADSLEIFDVSHNKLSLDTNSFECLNSLTELELDGNPIEVLPNNFISSLPLLRELSCCHLSGSFWKIEKYAFNSSSLKTLIFTRNNFKFMFSSFDNVEIFEHCPNLETLKLGKNNLNLTLEKLETMFRPLKNLRSLSLYSASLPHIPDIFVYMKNLSELTLSNNNIEGWKAELFKNVTSLRTLNLEKNKIRLINSTSFPPEMLTSLTTLALSGNPFSCTCDLRWFKTWTMKTLPRLNNTLQSWPRKYMCASPPELNGKLLVHVNLTDDMCSPVNVLTAVYVSVSVVASIICFSLVVVYKARWHIRYWIHLLRTKRTSNTVQEDLDYIYDGFVIYCDDDMEWVHKVLLPELEQQNSFRLCIHFRDFEIGKLIVDNIHDSIMSSRKIIIVLSNNFFKSEWCQFELRLAQSRLFTDGEDPLVLIMLEEIKNKHLSGPIRALFTTTTYGIWSKEESAIKLFWDQLRTSLRSPMSFNKKEVIT